eukprot:2475032-Rhodomonas_salina.1
MYIAKCLVLVSVVGSSTGISTSASGGSASGPRPEAAGPGAAVPEGWEGGGRGVGGWDCRDVNEGEGEMSDGREADVEW